MFQIDLTKQRESYNFYIMNLKVEEAVQLQSILNKLKEGIKPESLNELDQELLEKALSDPAYIKTFQAGEAEVKRQGLQIDSLTDVQAESIAQKVMAEQTLRPRVERLSPLSRALFKGIIERVNRRFHPEGNQGLKK